MRALCSRVGGWLLYLGGLFLDILASLEGESSW